MHVCVPVPVTELAAKGKNGYVPDQGTLPTLRHSCIKVKLS